MNLLCPNCQKMLTVPEQYAGQLMKCPLCAGTFTVPALPAAPQLAPAPPPPPPAPPATPGGDVYSVKQEPVAPPGPPPPAPPLTSAVKSTAPAPAPSVPTPPPAGYTRTHALTFKPRILQWVAPVSVVLIFILQFFSWVGVYPGGVPADTQGAWSAAFGSPGGEDPDVPGQFLFPDKKDTKGSLLPSKEELGASLFLIFYLLLFLPTLLVTVAVIVLPFLQLKLPPAIDKLLPYQWGIVAALNLLTFLFLVLQLIFGFNLENTCIAKWNKDAETLQKESPKKGTAADREQAINLGMKMDMLQRTFWLRLTVILHLLAIICAGLMYWINQRGESRPLPKIELLY